MIFVFEFHINCPCTAQFSKIIKGINFHNITGIFFSHSLLLTTFICLIYLNDKDSMIQNAFIQIAQNLCIVNFNLFSYQYQFKYMRLNDILLIDDKYINLLIVNLKHNQFILLQKLVVQHITIYQNKNYNKICNRRMHNFFFTHAPQHNHAERFPQRRRL